MAIDCSGRGSYYEELHEELAGQMVDWLLLRLMDSGQFLTITPFN